MHCTLGANDEAGRGSKSSSFSKVPSGVQTPVGGAGITAGTSLVGSTENLCQLELLLRVHVMMAELQGEGSNGHREACVAATGYCYFIWKVCWVLGEGVGFVSENTDTVLYHDFFILLPYSADYGRNCKRAG